MVKPKSVLNKFSLHKALIIAISLVYSLLFILPYSLVYRAGDEGVADERWVKLYIPDDIVTIIIFVPFALIWVTYLLLKPGLAKTIVKIILISLSGLYFILAFQEMTLIAQDFRPDAGVYLSLLLLPLLVWLLVIKHRSQIHTASLRE